MSETVCAMISDPCDAYWITSCMYENRHKFTRMFAKLPKYVKYYLQLEDKRLFEHLCEMQVNFDLIPELKTPETLLLIVTCSCFKGGVGKE